MGNIVESYNLKHQDFNSMIDFLQTDLAAGVDSLKASNFERGIEARLAQDPDRFGTDQFTDFMNIASDKSNPLSNDASTIIENVGKETLTSRSTLKEKIDILEAAEIGGRNSEVIAGKRKAMISMTESFHQMAENEIKAGLLSSTLEIYFPHMLKPSIARELGVTSGFSIGLTGMPSGINVDPGFVKHRKHLTVEDFNESMVEAFRQKGLKTPTGGEHLLDWDGIEIPDRFGDPMPILAETDPRILVQMRASSSAAALNTDEFLKKIVDPEIAGLSHGESYARKIAPGSKIPKGYVPVNIEGSSASGVLKDHVFHPEVAKHIEKYVNVTGDAKQMVQFHKGYRKIFEFWKGWTLGIYPAYHVRNEIGNLWNNHLADVTPRTQVIGDKRYKLGVYGASMDVAKGKEGYLITKAGKRIDYDEFRDMVDKNGITGSGIFAVENPEFYYKDPGSAGKQALVFGKGHDMSQSIVDAILKPFGREKLAGDISSLGVKLDESPSKNLLLGLGFMVGKGIENNARIAHFMQKIIDGETAISAGESVAKHLFDYTDLTKSERFFKQNLLPFYTFRRKNIPLQITNLMAQPAKFTMIRKFKSGFENDDDVPATSSLSEFLRENVPIRMKKGADGRHEYFLLGNWLPAADIETLLGVPSKSNISSVRLLEEGFKMIFPGVSRAAELAFNFETFRGRPIQDFPGQRETFMGQESILGQPITRPFVRTMESFRLLSEVDRFLKADLTVGQSLLRTATGARLFPFDKEREHLNRIFQTSTDMRKLASQQEREQTIDQIKLSRRGIR
jgi:hypothetical protein